MADGSLHPPEPDEAAVAPAPGLVDPFAALVAQAGVARDANDPRAVRNALVRCLVILWRQLSYRDRGDFLGGVNSAGDLEFDPAEAKRVKRQVEDMVLRNRLGQVSVEGEASKIALSIVNGRQPLSEKQIAFAKRCIREGKTLDHGVTE